MLLYPKLTAPLDLQMHFKFNHKWKTIVAKSALGEANSNNFVSEKSLVKFIYKKSKFTMASIIYQIHMVKGQ